MDCKNNTVNKVLVYYVQAVVSFCLPCVLLRLKFTAVETQNKAIILRDLCCWPDVFVARRTLPVVSELVLLLVIRKH